VRYTVVLVPDIRDGGFVAYVPVIPGCVTQGDTAEKAIAMAQDAATALLASMADHDEGVPREPLGTMVTSVEVVTPELTSAAPASEMIGAARS
jgi:predicted RNase H-like HicB family nuclease